jgi:hypothetical protein
MDPFGIGRVLPVFLPGKMGHANRKNRSMARRAPQSTEAVICLILKY